jgi:hypothetical protein
MAPYASTLAFFSDVVETEFSPFSVDLTAFKICFIEDKEPVV